MGRTGDLIAKILITVMSLFMFGVAVWAGDWTWIIIFGWLAALSTFMLTGEFIWGDWKRWKKPR